MELGGRPLSAEFSDLAEQTNGSVILKYGDTAVLATAVMSSRERDGADFFPLTVDYEERFYAAGEILGSRFVRREGKPSDEAILSGRITDRTIRPLFGQHIRREVQVVITVLSINGDDPDILGINAASLALAVSDIPWNGPVSAVRVGKLNGKFILNPTYKERENLELEITVSGKDGKISMIEASGREIPEEEIGAAFDFAVSEIKKIEEFQKKIISEIGKEKIIIPKEEMPEEGVKFFEKEISPRLPQAVFSSPGSGKINELKEEWLSLFRKEFPETSASLADGYYEESVNNLIHNAAVLESRRADGRKIDEVREIYAQAGGVSKMIHGTGIFYRGGTHIFSALTLGGPKDAQIIDGMEVRTEKRFLHHYNFPPFSSGEVGRMGGTNRRMIGHGALAERALLPIIPPKEEFPYTIRIVSESMASNGSTSMASVCGSTLALMDAGVPIKNPVAGIAMGLMMQDSDNYKILTDIQGPEDHHGDMDFKVAGTTDGVTAIQLDVKVDGIPTRTLKEALAGAKAARLHILGKMKEAIDKPRAEISSSAPKIISFKIKEDQIGLVIGPGGKTINKIKDDSGAEEIDIEDDGTVYITGKNGAAEKAAEEIRELTREFLPGDRLKGEVVKLFDFGAVVRIGPKTEGLVHISEMAPFRVNKVTDIVKEGEVVPVVVKEVGDNGKISLSIKLADPQFAEKKGVSPANFRR